VRDGIGRDERRDRDVDERGADAALGIALGIAHEDIGLGEAAANVAAGPGQRVHHIAREARRTSRCARAGERDVRTGAPANDRGAAVRLPGG
jgi:hypothetical protein